MIEYFKAIIFWLSRFNKNKPLNFLYRKELIQKKRHIYHIFSLQINKTQQKTLKKEEKGKIIRFKTKK